MVLKGYFFDKVQVKAWCCPWNAFCCSKRRNLGTYFVDVVFVLDCVRIEDDKILHLNHPGSNIFFLVEFEYNV